MENIVGLMDVDLSFSSPPPSTSSSTSTTASPNVPLALADLFSQASGSRPSRSLLLSSSNTILSWLECQAYSPSSDPSLCATAAVALAKLWRSRDSYGEVAGLAVATEGGHEGVEAEGEDEAIQDERDLHLATMMRDLLISSLYSPPAVSHGISLLASPNPIPSSIPNALEVLALTSVRGPIKELLATSPPFLSQLFGLIPPPSASRSSLIRLSMNLASLNHSIASIIHNLVMYRPQLAADQAQEGGTEGAAAAIGGDPLDDRPKVRARVRKLLSAGVVPVLISLGTTESRAITEVLGRCWLSIVESRKERGVVIQQGGVELITTSISSLLKLFRASYVSPPSSRHASSRRLSLHDSLFSDNATSSTRASIPSSLLPILQVLSKLIIASSPQTLSSPSSDPLDSTPSILPVALLLGHPDASLRQRISALRCLADLASLGPVMAGKVASCPVFIEQLALAAATKIADMRAGRTTSTKTGGASDGEGEVLEKVEQLLVEENNDLIRRACTELICTLLSSDVVFQRYSGEVPSLHSSRSSSPAPPASSSPSSFTSNASLTPSQTLALSKIDLLLSLTASTDLLTRLASSACLATLTSSPIAAKLLLLLPTSRAFSLIADLFGPHGSDPNDGEVGRGKGGVEGKGGLEEELVINGLVLLGNLMKLGGEEGKVVRVRMEEAEMKSVLEGVREELDGLERDGGGGEEMRGTLEEVLRALEV
jgi:hypothetical protein